MGALVRRTRRRARSSRRRTSRHAASTRRRTRASCLPRCARSLRPGSAPSSCRGGGSTRRSTTGCSWSRRRQRASASRWRFTSSRTVPARRPERPRTSSACIVKEGSPTSTCTTRTGIPPLAWDEALAPLSGVRIFGHTTLVGRAKASGFDGLYTYDVVTWNGALFRRLCSQAHAAGLLCAPSVGPGYDARLATRHAVVRQRNDGSTYDRMWKTAIRAGADVVTITSYNEWQEGTQIEPARSRSASPATKAPGARAASPRSARTWQRRRRGRRAWTRSHAELWRRTEAASADSVRADP